MMTVVVQLMIILIIDLIWCNFYNLLYIKIFLIKN